MKTSHKLIFRAIELANQKNLKSEVKPILDPFMKDPDSLDLFTIARLEVLLDEQLLIIPTKQQWRRIKLERLNEISKENE
jgi:hypothetical protein